MCTARAARRAPRVRDGDGVCREKYRVGRPARVVTVNEERRIRRGAHEVRVADHADREGRLDEGGTEREGHLMR